MVGHAKCSRTACSSTNLTHVHTTLPTNRGGGNLYCTKCARRINANPDCENLLVPIVEGQLKELFIDKDGRPVIPMPK